jgi:hypothetical protein
MKRFLLAAVLAFGIGACSFNPLATVTNPVNTTRLYQAELVFAGSLKTFNTLKGLCAQRALPPKCRTYVLQGQPLIGKIYAADKAARNFVDNNPTLDATNVVQAVTGLVSDFDATVIALSQTGAAR